MQSSNIEVALQRLPEKISKIAILLNSYLSKGAKKSSFYYRSKISGREGKYVVDLGIDYGAAKKESLAEIANYRDYLIQKFPDYPNHPDIEIAEKILNPKPRKASAFNQNKISLGHGISIAATRDNPDDYKLYIYAYIASASEVEEVVPSNKEKKFSASEDLHRRLETKLSRFRQFILSPENISGLTYKGGIIEFQNEVE